MQEVTEDVQKYQKGDHVRVAKDLGRSMSHFQNDCEAIIVGSYADQFGGSSTDRYTIHTKDYGQTSWYDESQLDLIESGRGDLLDTWEKEEAEEVELKSSLDWIFANGKHVAEAPHGASIQALANCFGLTNLWGNRGEGMTWQVNAMKTMAIATPFLVNGDKDGWLEFCEKAQVVNGDGKT